MKDNKIVKEYRIEVIASIVENALFCTNEELFDFCSDLIGEDIGAIDFMTYLKSVEYEIRRQYPNIKRITSYPTSDYGESSIYHVVNEYKERYGDTLTFEVKNTKRKILKPFHFKYKK